MAAEASLRLARSWYVLERVLFAVGVLALGWYATVRVSAAREQASWAQQLEQELPAKPQFALPRSVPTRVAPPRWTLVGRIELPRVGVSAMAREGVDGRTLRSAVGHVPDSALPGEPGNAAFAAHRDTYFRPLKDVRPGDRIVMTTPAGTFEYVVRETRVVSPTDLSVLESTPNPTLTLITCYPFDYIGSAPHRFIVRAEAAF